MSYNPNGPRNTSGSTGYGTSTPVQTAPVETHVEEAAESLRDKAEHFASNVKDKASELGSTVADRANSAVNTVGERISDVAGALRDKAPSSLAPYADRAADTLERAGSYLQHSDFGDFFDDVSGIIRRHPVPAMLTGVALGFILARNSRR
jgi:hypothetical protein